MGLLAYLRKTNRNLKVKTSNKTTKLFKIINLMQGQSGQSQIFSACLGHTRIKRTFTEAF